MKRISSISFTLTCLAVAGLALGGCKNNSEDKQPYAVDSAGNVAQPVPGTATDSNMASTGRTDTASAGKPTSAQLTQENIWAMVQAANAEEVSEGKVGAERAKNAAVKKFAQMLMDDHGKMMDDGAALAARLNVTPEPPPGDTSGIKLQHMMEMLSAAPANSFDSLFLATQVDGHQKTLDQLHMLQGMAQHDSLKAMIAGAIPIVQNHLDEARSLQKKVK